jgi:hypothetical protein
MKLYTFGASTDDRVWFSIGNYSSDINPFQIAWWLACLF